MHEHACIVMTPTAANGWLKAHPIPSDKGSYGNFEDVQLGNEVCRIFVN
jgi:predicted metalloendopeptidase